MRAFNRLFSVLLLSSFGISCAPLQAIDPIYLKSNELAGGLLGNEEESNYRPGKRNIRYKAFPDDDNSYLVDRFLFYYTEGQGRDIMKRYLARSNRYIDFMGDILEGEGLPRDLVYISMAESGFWPYAKSNKGAVGYWQFIPATARRYGLTMNHYVDARQDFFLSTQAAARYLKFLYGLFEDWHLAIAAYNCGEGCISNITKKYKSKNFWYLAHNDILNEETKEFVPKVIAMRKIALDPERYDFFDIEYKEPLDYELFAFRGASSLSQISRDYNISYNELKGLNSKLKTDTVPAEGQKSYVRLPAHTYL